MKEKDSKHINMITLIYRTFCDAMGRLLNAILNVVYTKKNIWRDVQKHSEQLFAGQNDPSDARRNTPPLTHPFTVSALFSAACNYGDSHVWCRASTAFLHLQLLSAGLPQFASAACHHPSFTVPMLN